ncbi:NAD(P)-dependent oxidoreductase [Carnobacterium sp. ISL-102]|uniref:NAD-dependent epimerase/dehydratase family protein n=1 Tax=Carnobacterium sp. ISL-102 TaxID=2819142 RepID=UPI001BE93627|nr:NAD(P)-dependent oxidoreductase [Carnobacterium sp. ISL-102]MBT2732064.1 NAD(P)-dependent oxidoreductase [Carnobacterium sp. ISL-102]
MAKILITGAAGRIGRVLTTHLKKEHQLTLVDIAFSDSDKELVKGTVTKKLDLSVLENWKDLLNEIEYVIHLAGDPSPEAKFYDSLLDLNYKIPHNLYLEASKNNFIKRIIFASSIHAVDAYPQNVQVATTDPVRPADLYGVSKVYLEGLASHYAFTTGLESIGIRIGAFRDDDIPAKDDPGAMSDYLSSRDMCHLVDCCLRATLKQPFLLVNGVSNNTFPRLDIDQARVDIGYQPKDDGFKMYGYFKQD